MQDSLDFHTQTHPPPSSEILDVPSDWNCKFSSSYSHLGFIGKIFHPANHPAEEADPLAEFNVLFSYILLLFVVDISLMQEGIHHIYFPEVFLNDVLALLELSFLPLNRSIFNFLQDLDSFTLKQFVLNLLLK